MGWYNEELIGMAKNAGYDALFTVEDVPKYAGRRCIQNQESVCRRRL